VGTRITDASSVWESKEVRMKQDKVKEIHKMMKYLSSTHNDYVSTCSSEPGVFYSGCFKIPHIDPKDHCENYSFIVDFNKKSITLNGYNISGHNGDSYGNIYTEIPWAHLLTGYEELKELALDKSKVEAYAEIKKARNIRLTKAAETRLNKILKDM